MRSIHSLYKSARDNDDDNTAISSRGQASSLETLTGVGVGSGTTRVSNVASPPATIPSAGTMVWETTRKIVLFSDGTSMRTAEGSVA